ncbi:sensor histidine kinase [Cytobacillus sp. Hm23]
MRIKYIYQLIGSHISILIIALLILSLLFTHFVENLVFQNKVDELLSFGDEILSVIDQSSIETEKPLKQYNEVLRARNIRLIMFDSKGSILSPFVDRFKQIQLDERELHQISNGDTVIIKHDIQRFDQEASLVAIPYVIDQKVQGGILLIAPISNTQDMISSLNRALLYTVIISLSISLLLSWLLSKLHVRRIQHIREATSMIADGNYNVNVPDTTLDELGELAADFNQMASKLRESNDEINRLEKRRRQFIADVSHELRTPLTTISGIIEGLKNNMIPEQEKDKGLNLISTESKRLIRLVNENLDYENIRSLQIQLHKVDIQLLEIFEIIKEHLITQAEEKNNRVIIQVDEGIYIHADYDRLMQILINITKNSIQFTSDGTIWLRGKKGYNEVIIVIEDTGMGIDSKEIEMIWHRFYKADISRRNNPYGEFGLGLAIVKQLVNLHGGEITVDSKKQYGTKFIIAFPISKSETVNHIDKSVD